VASPDLQRSSATGSVGRHVAVSEPAAVTSPAAADDPAVSERAVSEQGVADDVRAQIRNRVAERRSVGFSLGDPAVRRRALKRKRQDRRRHRYQRPPRLSGWAQVVVFAVITALIVIGLRSFVVASFYIPSGSMEPTLHGCPGCEPDLVMVERLSYRFSHVSRGDVVVFSKPPSLAAPDKELIKRVIGLPGETISGHNGKVWIGNRPLSEPYVNPACGGQDTFDFAPVKIPPGRYFMMGDNRCDSEDSRYFGTVAGNTIVGRAFAVVWPYKHWRWL
jgi:signal peptidase I